MEFYRVISIATLFLAFVLASFEFSTCYVLKGSVTCLDCAQHSHFSDIKIMVKCNQVQNATSATTKPDGSFKTKLPSNAPTPYCVARILGASYQLYASNKTMGQPVIKAHGSKPESFVVSKPLEFYKSCPLKDGKCGHGLGSTKTIDIPFPREWGLPPSSYYLSPFFYPIIGIP